MKIHKAIQSGHTIHECYAVDREDRHVITNRTNFSRIYVNKNGLFNVTIF